jgi:peptidoglycan/xylan/chitin deacetylase (PgdA/CDA1 family)
VLESAVSVTFDNLGEAAQLELGMWPADVQQGQHFTVLEVLPRLVELLAARKVKATFFVEGLNAQMYPQALVQIQDSGHEVAAHAWRHEQWSVLDLDSERTLLERLTGALRSIEIEPRGFRPPGGGLTAHTSRLLGEHGYTYVSPAGDLPGALDGLAVLPFRWPLVDAYAYMPHFAGLRERFGDGEEPLGPRWMVETMIAAVRSQAQSAGHTTLIFHPFSAAFTGEPGWEALDQILSELVSLAGEGALAVVRMDEAARWLLERGDENHPPLLDEITWAAP